jgi:hypothetical protein
MRAQTFALTAVALLSLGISPLAAKEVAFPQQEPRFTIEVPDTWKPVFREGSLTLLPIPEDGFLIQVNQQPAAAQELLDKLTERIAAQMQFSEIKLGRESEAETEHDVECAMITSSGKSGGVDVVVTVVAFTLEDDRHFTIQSAGPAGLNQKHKGVLLGIVDSIKPIEEE